MTRLTITSVNAYRSGATVPTQDRAVGRTLEREDLVDIAAEPARRDDDPDLCAPTGHGGARVDQSWANHAVAPAVQRYATFGTVRWTDHHGVVCRTDTDAIDRSEIMVWA